MSYHATDVVSVQTAAYPEGPTVRVGPADARWPAVSSALPSHLPAATSGSNCGQGNVTTITLKNGSTLRYGPCHRPKSIEALRCIIAGQKPGCV